MPLESATKIPPLTQSRLVIVSGKGGVGKTTVAASIALAAAQTGRKVLIIEVEQREGVARLFGRDHVGYHERQLAPNVHGLSVIPDEALLEYLYLFYGIGRIARPLLTGRAVDFATSTAPGLRDILLIGKVKEAENRRTVHGDFAYDLIVLDAPPTGRLPRFLDAPRAVVDLVHSGAIQQQAQGVLDLLEDPNRTRVILVTLASFMPVQETNEAIQSMRSMGIALGPIVVNSRHPEQFAPKQQARLNASALIEEAQAAGITLEQAQAEAIATIGRAEVRRSNLERSALEELDAELPRYELPALMTPLIGPHEISELASMLHAQGAL
ncbi:MAG: ArsA family ATPase [Actinomycetota bacterium]